MSLHISGLRRAYNLCTVACLGLPWPALACLGWGSPPAKKPAKRRCSGVQAHCSRVRNSHSEKSTSSLLDRVNKQIEILILIASGAAEFGSLAWKMREGSRSRPLAPRVLVRVCSVHPRPNSSAFYMHRWASFGICGHPQQSFGVQITASMSLETLAERQGPTWQAWRLRS